MIESGDTKSDQYRSSSILGLVVVNLVAIYSASLLFGLPGQMDWTPLFPIIIWYESPSNPVSWLALSLFLCAVVVASAKGRRLKWAWILLPVCLSLWSLLVARALAVTFAV